MDTLPPQVEPECKAALLDVQAVAQLRKCSPRHVYRLADAGQMPLPTKIGTLNHWPQSEIESWIASGCPSSEPDSDGS